MYPALTVTERVSDDTDILWVGSEGGMEAELVARANLPYRGIRAAGVHGVSLRQLPGNLVKLWQGYKQSKQILKEYKPDVIMFTGGYLAIPMALAGLTIRTLLFVPDIEPGLALKTLARFSDKIAVSVEDSRRFFTKKEKVEVTGYPLRQDLMKWTKADALAYFGFSSEKPVILFTGGSSGARSINKAVITILKDLLKHYQVIHLTGHLDWETVRAATSNLPQTYQAFPYLHEMGAAYAAADLVVSRAGASVLGEYPFFGLPAILVPYPYAWRYQKVNADYLVEREAAILLEDQYLQTQLFAQVEMLVQDKARLQHMQRSMKALSQPQAAERIAHLLYEMAEG
ncbi:MAG TPA: undecaprenyldiphospho-muramoylpentapeptide beta-N-acetylglucosaminyltransferase [Anaerolineaceae bacterium]|nr:undecaprenyldiphospho-muramoylpentapeptide beta-N-acetylglucosaminyltransferase [Anaerolineaceae bacterium]